MFDISMGVTVVRVWEKCEFVRTTGLRTCRRRVTGYMSLPHVSL